MATDTLELSIVVPVYNEELNLPEMIRRTLDACEAMKRSYEIILVDDGSVDKSASMIEEASLKYPHKIIGVMSSAQSAKTGRTPSSANLRPRQST